MDILFTRWHHGNYTHSTEHTISVIVKYVCYTHCCPPQEDIGCLAEADQPASSYLGPASHDLNGAECVPWNTAVTGVFPRTVRLDVCMFQGTGVKGVFPWTNVFYLLL